VPRKRSNKKKSDTAKPAAKAQEAKAGAQADIPVWQTRLLETLKPLRQALRQGRQRLEFPSMLPRSPLLDMPIDFLPKKKKRKKSAPVGRPHEYNVPAICKIAEDYMKDHGVPDKLAWLCEKVRDRAEGHLKLPERARLNQILSPVWKRAKKKV
jgi:hypothetical protein